MEPKKNPKYDVHRQSRMFFMMSLAISIALVIMAFQWKAPVQNDTGREWSKPDEVETYAFTEIKSIAPAKPKPETADQKIPVKKTRDPINFIEVQNDLIKPGTETPMVEDQNDPQQQVGMEWGDGMPPEDLETIFIVVEKMPEPIGGFKGFYETINKNITYPMKAKRNGVQGKVLVEFVINEDDHLSHFKIIQGIGAGCDEEAMRVIGLTKWKAGKQRGKPVKVKMVLPLMFTLQ
ncbi:MAG: TonB family protein [Cyclobacteriaceae bacterium]|nr:TonB family protein [Cyclobacteriaceae bacterium]